MYQSRRTSDNRFHRVDNPELSVAMGYLIAIGRIRKENARELLIELGIYRFIELKEQTLVPHLVDAILRITRNWKSPNDGIYKMGGAWWMQEATERCITLSCLFTESEQCGIAEKLFQKAPKSPS